MSPDPAAIPPLSELKRAASGSFATYDGSVRVGLVLEVGATAYAFDALDRPVGAFRGSSRRLDAARAIPGVAAATRSLSVKGGA